MSYDWLLFLHLLGAFALLTTSFAVHAVYLAARRRGRTPAEVLVLLGIARRVAPFIGLSGLVTLAFGIWLVVELRFDWGDAWIVLSLILFAIGMAGGPILGRLLAPAGMLAGRLASEGTADAHEVWRALNAPSVLALAAITGVAPYVILGLMIFKPGLA